jgi:hypothetical protein
MISKDDLGKCPGIAQFSVAAIITRVFMVPTKTHTILLSVFYSFFFRLTN